MQTDQTPTHGRPSTARAVRHHLVVVAILLALGALGGLDVQRLDGGVVHQHDARADQPVGRATRSAPAPASVRQDQETSLETEAQVVRSAEVLDAVSGQAPALTTARLERGLRVTVPANTQILEISYTATDRVVAQQVADAVAGAYLANRAERFESVTVRAHREHRDPDPERGRRPARRDRGLAGGQRGQAGLQQPAGRRPAQRARQPARPAHRPGEQRDAGRAP